MKTFKRTKYTVWLIKILVILFVSFITGFLLDGHIYFEKETYFWVSSTIIQSLAALVALTAMFYIHRLNELDSLIEKFEKYQEYLAINQLYYQKELNKEQMEWIDKTIKATQRKIEILRQKKQLTRLDLRETLSVVSFAILFTLLVLPFGKFQLMSSFLKQISVFYFHYPIAWLAFIILFAIYAMLTVFYYLNKYLTMESKEEEEFSTYPKPSAESKPYWFLRDFME